jgi:AraC-like DNA-binding protein
MQRSREADESGARKHLVGLLLDQITSSRTLPLHMPMPRGGVLREIAVSLLDCPTDPRSIEDLSSMAAISVRTLERRFRSETGLSLRTFRRQAKLFKALEMLSACASINEISDTLGFENPSTFIAMFKAAFGVSPGRYIKAANLD